MRLSVKEGANASANSRTYQSNHDHHIERALRGWHEELIQPRQIRAASQHRSEWELADQEY